MEKVLNKQHLETLESLKINNDVKDGLREFLNKYDMHVTSDESPENLIKKIKSTKDFNECVHNIILLSDYYTGDEEDIRIFLQKYDNLLRVFKILNNLYLFAERLPSNDEINKTYKDALDQFNLLNN